MWPASRRATGPTSGAVVEVELGAKRDGHIVAAQSILKFQAGAFPGSPVQQGCICSMAVYDFPNALTVGYDVVSNRPKVAAYRAPGAPIGTFALESCVDELARELGIDPLRMREINGAKDGVKVDARRHLGQYRLSKDAGGRACQRTHEGRAGAQPGPRHCLGLLAQCWRRIERRGATSTRTAR